MPDILIADDFENWRVFCGELFDIAGYSCDFADRAKSAIRKLTALEFRLICVNLDLDGYGEGEALLERLKSHFSTVPIILVTGHFWGSSAYFDDISAEIEALQVRYPNIRRVLLKADPEKPDDAFMTALLQGVQSLLGKPAHTTSAHYDLLMNGTSDFITWLHLSDFHFKAGTQWDTEIVLEHLLEDIESRGAIDPSLQQIDFVFITGDLSFSGKSDEYENARSFLKKLRRVAGVRKDRIFVVSGNHDVDRDQIPPMIRGNLPSNRNAVNAIYQDIQSRTAYLRRFDGYRCFINSKYKRMSLNDEDLFYVKHRTIRNHVIRIIGLNSAWISEDDDEDGKLILGDIQVREALKLGSSRGKADLNISLLHHPLNWLNEFDKVDCRPLCYGEFDFLLHGHLHGTDVLSLQEPGRRAMVVGAGACYMGRDRPNAYNYVCLDFENRRGTVYFREYTDMDAGHWTKDTRTYKAAPDGKYDFEF